MKTCGIFLAVSSAAALAASNAALATTISPALFSGTLVLDPTMLVSAGGLTSTVCNPSPDGCESQTLTESYSGGVLAITNFGTATAPQPPQMQSYGDALFYFTVLGPVGGTATLDFSAAGSTSVTEPAGGVGWASVAAYVSAINSGETAVASSCSVGSGVDSVHLAYDCGSLSTAGSFSGTTAFTVPTGELDWVSFTFGSNAFYGEGSYSIGIDPTISFAPGFDTDGYSLLLSPDAPGGVPEPAAWALMLAGFAGLGAALRFRRASPAAG